MRSFSVVLLGLLVALAWAEDDNQNVQPETAQEALAETIFQIEAIQHCLANPSKNDRTKRQAGFFGYNNYNNYNNYGNYRNYGFDNYLDLGLGFRRYDYRYLPNSLGYNARYANYYPEDLRLNLYRQPVAQFFNSFYPGPIVRPSAGVVQRTYLRTGTYQNALTDFRLFPLNNVRSLTTETTTTTDVVNPGFVGTFRDLPYQVRVCENCCNGGNPCITFTGQTYPFQQVTRNYMYVQNTRRVSNFNNVLV